MYVPSCRSKLSILPAEEADTCDVMTRENRCVMGHINEHERQKIAKEKRARLAKGTGQHVEVFVAQERDWYQGQVVDNGVIAGTRLLSVKFSNGAILRNVRPNELRVVPRTTFMGWVYTVQCLLLSGGVFIFQLISAVNNMGLPYEERGTWLFFDRPILSNGTATSLYNLTWGEVAAADAYPETWLHTYTPRNLNASARLQFRSEPMKRFYCVQVFSRFANNVGFTFAYFSLLLMFAANMQLRRLPKHAQISWMVVIPAVFGMQSVSSFYVDNNANFFLQLFGFIIVIFFVHIILFPIMFGLARRNKRVRSVQRVWMAATVFHLVMFALALGRMLYARKLLEHVANATQTGDSLERLAGVITYLTSAMVSADPYLLQNLPLGVMVGYATLQDHGVLSTSLKAFFFIIGVPIIAVVYLIEQPLDFIDPINYRLVFSTHATGLSQQSEATVSLSRNMTTIPFNILIIFVIASYTLSVFVPIIISSRKRLRAIIATGTLAKRVRKALLAEATTTPRKHSDPGVAGYKALKDRPISQSILRPVCGMFERQLDKSDAHLQKPQPCLLCLAPVFSATRQLAKVFVASGVVLAGYMAEVVAGVQSPTQRDTLRAMLEIVLDNMSCCAADRDCVLRLAKQSETDSLSGPSNSSSLSQLREVVTQLGTKHRDSIYMLCMEGVAREPGFCEFVEFVDRLQSDAAGFMGSMQLRQRVVPKTNAVSWADSVVTLLDSANGVRSRYNAFMQTVAEKSGAEFQPAPLKGVSRLAEKLWLRSVHDTEFPQGDCTNVLDVVRGMLVCSNIGVLNVCTSMLASCDEMLDRRLHVGENAADIAAAEVAGITTRIRLMRAKNRFGCPTPGGWADVLIK